MVRTDLCQHRLTRSRPCSGPDRPARLGAWAGSLDCAFHGIPRLGKRLAHGLAQVPRPNRGPPVRAGGFFLRSTLRGT
jgi:hypothetical protein